MSTAPHGTSHDGDHSVGHVVSPKILIANCIALLILTVITVAVAKLDFMHFNMYEMDIIVALAVAVVKAALVCLFFMHLYWDRPFNAFVLVGSIAFVALFMALAMLDTFEYSQFLHPGDPEAVTTRIQSVEP
jgi:cytochrome c oxidase subunit 4